MRNKPLSVALLILLKPTVSLMLICLTGCVTDPKNTSKQPLVTDPSTGGLLETMQALKTGLYAQHLQLQRNELHRWQNANIQQQVTANKLKAAKEKTGNEVDNLAQTVSNHSKQIENSQKSIQALSQQHAKLVANIKTIELATQQLAQKAQQQLAQRQTEQQRIASLVVERDRLRQALSTLIQTDSSLSE